MVQEELMSRISDSIRNNDKHPALIPFIVSGYPSLELTKDILYRFQSKGVAAVELGIPFSDPLADGPVIQNAANAAIASGVNISKIFDLLDDIKDDYHTPIILFSYFNPILNYGFKSFLEKASQVNVSGIIVPDLPLEESEEFSDLCRSYGIDFIMLVAPTSDKDRIKAITQKTSGFVYLVSSTGVTGVRDSFSNVLSKIKSVIKSCSDVPIAVGFGVSKPEHISELRKLGIDGAIVGSAVIKIIDQYKDDKSQLVDKIAEYIDYLYSF